MRISDLSSDVCSSDLFGVLPPIAHLTPEQAMYHFLSGYTAKVAGTELGVTEPEATFSTCFGAPFMPRHHSVYGNLLRRRIARGGSSEERRVGKDSDGTCRSGGSASPSKTKQE